MRITFVMTHFLSEKISNGGVAVLINLFAQALLVHGHEVQVITLSDEDERTLEFQGITVYRLKTPRWANQLIKLMRRRFYGPIVTGLFAWRAHLKLKQLHQENPIDIIHLVNDEAVGLFITRFSHIPNVMTLTSFSPLVAQANQTPQSLSLALQLWMNKFAVVGTRFAYSCSYRIKNLTEKHYHIKTQDVIRNPFIFENLPTKSLPDVLAEKMYVLYFGRLEPLKGVYTFAEALPSFFEQYPNAYAVFVGRVERGIQTDNMQQDIETVCKDYLDRIIFLPPQHHTSLMPIIQQAKVVVLPSLFDNIPYSGIETLSLGKVLIATDQSTFDEIIEHGVNGFIVPTNNPSALGQCLIDVWERPDLYEIGQRAHQLAWNTFRSDLIIEQLLALYQKAIDNA